MEASIPGTSAMLSQRSAECHRQSFADGSVIQFDRAGRFTPQNVNVFYLGSGIAPEAGIEGVIDAGGFHPDLDGRCVRITGSRCGETD